MRWFVPARLPGVLGLGVPYPDSSGARAAAASAAFLCCNLVHARPPATPVMQFTDGGCGAGYGGARRRPRELGRVNRVRVAARGDKEFDVGLLTSSELPAGCSRRRETAPGQPPVLGGIRTDQKSAVLINRAEENAR